MIRRKITQTTIDLDGPEGNAYCLLGYAKQFCKELNYTEEQKNKLLKEMKSSDYNNLVQTFNSEFNRYIILETEQQELLELFGSSNQLSYI